MFDPANEALDGIIASTLTHLWARGRHPLRARGVSAGGCGAAHFPAVGVDSDAGCPDFHVDRMGGTVLSRWKVIKRGPVWAILSPDGHWHDSADSLREAHDEATKYAIYDALNMRQGLLCFATMRAMARMWMADNTRHWWGAA